jgi:hypothetical protein
MSPPDSLAVHALAVALCTSHATQDSESFIRHLSRCGWRPSPTTPTPCPPTSIRLKYAGPLFAYIYRRFSEDAVHAFAAAESLPGVPVRRKRPRSESPSRGRAVCARLV